MYDDLHEEELKISPGIKIGDFTVERRLGAGGMGEVWLATQEVMDRQIALKVLYPKYGNDPDFVTRFKHEIKMVGKLQHPNIVTAYYAGVDGPYHYLAEEYVDGAELNDRLDIDTFIPEKEALEIARGVAEALKYAWDKYRILHRDIKPANIVLTEDGVPMLMDLGISKSLTEDSSLTMTGMIVGTPFYISPEQAKADSGLDCRSDIYSLGVTIYHMVTGAVPYDASTAMAVIAKHITEPFPNPQDKNPRVSEFCCALIGRMMGKKPDDRQQSWDQVICDIDNVLNGEYPDSGIPDLGKSTIMKATGKNHHTVKIVDDKAKVKNQKAKAETSPKMVAAKSPAKKEKIKLSLNDLKKAPEGNIIGIDLGTTYSVVAWLNKHGKVEIVPNMDGYSTTPSVVFIDGDNILVGREASRAALLEPELAAECFKRDMGLENFSKRVNQMTFRPEVLSAFVLRKLKQDAEDKIGPVSEAVVTVPAYFDDARRKATMDAGEITGLKIKAIINEPCAAALWYAFSAKETVKPGAIFLVYDLGGGTFDATLMKIVGPNEFETLATDGDVMLGGRDWDKRLLDYIAGEVMKTEGVDPRENDNTYQELIQRVEESKRALSKRPSVNVPVSYQGKRTKVTVSREKFKELTIDLLNRTQTTVELLLAEIDLDWQAVDSVIAVGGSSRMTMVGEMLENISGKKVNTVLDADLSIAQGAAVYAASLRAKESGRTDLYADAISKKLVAMDHKNVNSHSLGIEVVNDENNQPANFIIIKKNTPIPCEYKTEFGLASPSVSGSKIKVKVLEGESLNPEVCVHVGTCTIKDLPPGLPVGSPVEVTFSYTQQGRIEVRALAKEVGVEATATIISNSGLSEKMIKEQIQAMEGLSVS